MFSPRRAAGAAAVLGALLGAPSVASANHHACPVVAYQPGESGGYQSGVNYRQTSSDRVEATFSYRQENGGTGLRTSIHTMDGSHISMSFAGQSAPGNFSVARANCTPVFVPYPIGGPKSPLPSGASFPVPWLPIVPGFSTPQPPDLGANGDLFPPLNPLQELGPDLKPLRPNLSDAPILPGLPGIGALAGLSAGIRAAYVPSPAGDGHGHQH